ncbi:MAG: hypothetical protein ACRDTG_00685 [Pseudonocardiaceae bacterium]
MRERRDTEDWQRRTLHTITRRYKDTQRSATRRRKSSLLVPGDLLVTDKVSGDALNVLNTVVSYWLT